jgi:glycerate kinase
VLASYGVLDETKTAVIEMASAAGLTMVPENMRNPFHTTTFGVGEMIADAIQNEGCRSFIVGIGGSATNDGGIGMLQALGFSFLDENGKEIPFGALGIEHLHRIETRNAMKALSECHFSVACDVKNPLCGANGCSAVFAPQKGATAAMIEKMDAWLSLYAEKTKLFVNGEANADFPGCGAAGGLGFAFLSYLHAELKSGIALVMEFSALEEKIRLADLVITGEGCLDGQSCMGKAPVGVAMLAKKYGKPVIAVAGTVKSDANLTHQYGIDAFFPILRKPCQLSEAMETKNAYQNLKQTSEEIFRLFNIRKN